MDISTAPRRKTVSRLRTPQSGRQDGQVASLDRKSTMLTDGTELWTKARFMCVGLKRTMVGLRTTTTTAAAAAAAAAATTTMKLYSVRWLLLSSPCTE
ncbi:hypothetical protein NOR_04212 [Metarhizium rileyi]|uniref:Uncharacterized protein n=1 Tax=Metarhizium rileyi (strain RCEF 4871) TaxID=1649241 RepID=A0A167EBJ9_METRR|nr:hypothetical protein NOR_04212 [Metarhizium rileyi RCEF 4871]